MGYDDLMKKTESNPGTIKAWRGRIVDRLSGKVIDPPIPSRSEDGLETFLVDQYLESSPMERGEIDLAVLDILLSVRRDRIPPEWLGYLFQFIRQGRIESVGDVLVSLFIADSTLGNPLRSNRGAYQDSQLHELMHAIRDLRPAEGALAWRTYLDDPDLAQFAFYGLVESDLDAAVESLPRLLATDVARIPISKHNCLAYLLAQWRENRPHREPVAALLLRFDDDEVEGCSASIRELLGSIPSARPYFEAYDAIKAITIKNRILDRDGVRTLMKASEKNLFIDLKTILMVMECFRKMVKSIPIFTSTGKAMLVYESTASIAPPQFLMAAAA